MTRERERWRDLVKARVEHLQRYEEQQGHQYAYVEGVFPLTRNIEIVPQREEEGGGYRCEEE